MAESQTEIETGVETDNERIRTMEHDAEAYADDGEYATVWRLTRMNEATVDGTVVDVTVFRSEAGRRELDRAANTVHELEPDQTTREFAQELAEADPELAVELARKFFVDS